MGNHLNNPQLAIAPAEGNKITSQLTNNTYTIGSKIGEGNYGIVFSCTDVWGNDLAAKVFKPDGTYEEIHKRAAAEFSKLMQVRNPFITFVHDAFEYQDTFFIITERCAGSLQELFTDPQHLSVQIVKPVARCLLQAVHYLHLNNIVHQDIHPGNVFAALVKDELSPSSSRVLQFKLADLGVAKLFGEVDVQNTRAQWMLPPEVYNPAEFGPIDHRIDIYHIGLLLLQLASAQELQFTEDQILSGFPRDMAMQLPSPFDFALEKALRRHVECRTQTALELWSDINRPA